jgi:polynucleotide 5'-kinase involved in rRNA processing
MESQLSHITLLKGHELCIEIVEGKSLFITLLCGEIEIFGSVLVNNKKYNYFGPNISLFAFDLSIIVIEGTPNFFYTLSYPIFQSYMRTFEIIEEKWIFAEKQFSTCPCVIVTGSKNSGKKNLIQTLSNFITRMGRNLTVMDLNYQGLVSLPGCISGFVVNKPWNLEYKISSKSIMLNYGSGMQ